MATLEQLHDALIKADAAGNVDDARAFAAEIQKMRSVQPEAAQPSMMQSIKQGAGNLVAGAVRGAGSIGATLLYPIDKATDIIKGDRGPNVTGLVTGKQPLSRNEERRQQMDEGLRSLGADPDSLMYKGGKLAGEIAGTAGTGNVLALGAKGMGAAPTIVNALRTGGMTTGGGQTLGRELATRAGAGALVGGASTALVSPEDAGMGAMIGGAFPMVGKVAEKAGNAVGSVVRPFYKSGQERIAGDVLRDFSENPTNALAQLYKSGEVVKGSLPTTAMAAGDNGIAALSRAMQNADPRYASELATRQTAQNQARTAALEEIAGNTGKLNIAKAARDAVTSPMRENVLNAAGKVQVGDILGQIDTLISNPNNAGKISQQALNEFRNSISKAAQDGAIDARALYEIRKDIGTTLSGKLQGEAGNLRYASGQLNNVKGIIDDAIDMASKSVKGTGTGVMAGAGGVPAVPSQISAQMPRSSWSDYLQKYSSESIPIDQMKKLDEILKRVQTGSVDSQGGLILSGAKLNNILKNESDVLKKALAPEQLDILRRVSADLNASQIASNTGRAVGSNTLQNMAQNQVLTSVLGKTIGASSPATATLGRLLQLPYGTANKQIQEKLGNALLDPKEAARLMRDPQANALIQMLMESSAKTTPAIASR